MVKQSEFIRSIKRWTPAVFTRSDEDADGVAGYTRVKVQDAHDNNRSVYCMSWFFLIFALWIITVVLSGVLVPNLNKVHEQTRMDREIVQRLVRHPLCNRSDDGSTHRHCRMIPVVYHGVGGVEKIIFTLANDTISSFFGRCATVKSASKNLALYESKTFDHQIDIMVHQVKTYLYVWIRPFSGEITRALTLFVGPIMSTPMNLINFAYRTIIEREDDNLMLSIGKFLFQDCIFLVPNIIWMYTLIHTTTILSPLAIVVNSYLDREVYVVMYCHKDRVDGRLFRYKVIWAIIDTIRSLRNSFMYILHSMMLTASIGFFAVCYRCYTTVAETTLAELPMDPVTRKMTVFANPAEIHISSRVWDYVTELASRIFFSPEEFSIKTTFYVERMYNKGVTAFDTNEAVIARIAMAVVICIVVYMKFRKTPKIDAKSSSSDAKTIVVESRNEWIKEFFAAHLLPCATSRPIYQRGNVEIWHTTMIHLRASIFAINASPILKDLIFDKQGSLWALAACVIFLYCIIMAATSLYERRRTAVSGYITVAFLIMLIGLSGTRLHESPRFSETFPAVGHASPDRGLLNYMFDLIDSRTMSIHNAYRVEAEPNLNLEKSFWSLGDGSQSELGSASNQRANAISHVSEVRDKEETEDKKDVFSDAEADTENTPETNKDTYGAISLIRSIFAHSWYHAIIRDIVNFTNSLRRAIF